VGFLQIPLTDKQADGCWWMDDKSKHVSSRGIFVATADWRQTWATPDRESSSKEKVIFLLFYSPFRHLSVPFLHLSTLPN